MAAQLRLTWDRLAGSRVTGQVDHLPFTLSPTDPAMPIEQVGKAIRAFVVARVNPTVEVLVHPEGWFVVQGGAAGSGLWSLVGA